MGSVARDDRLLPGGDVNSLVHCTALCDTTNQCDIGRKHTNARMSKIGSARRADIPLWPDQQWVECGGHRRSDL